MIKNKYLVRILITLAIIFIIAYAVNFYFEKKQLTAENGNLKDENSHLKSSLIKQIELCSVPLQSTAASSYDASMKNVIFLKENIEKDGYRHFYGPDKKNISRSEKLLQSFYGMTWSDNENNKFDINREPNNGRGCVDFKVSKGADKTLIEFKLASNSSLKNLSKQVEIYEKDNCTNQSIKVIIYFTAKEEEKVKRVLNNELLTDSNIILIDARKDNKQSASVC